MRHKVYLNMNVVEAARKRVIGIFSNPNPIIVSFSGGKDSLCLLTIVLDLIQDGLIDKSKLTVVFFDEEAVYPEMYDTAILYRNICLQRGIKYVWYALEIMHYNVYNSLRNDISFVCFDSTKKDLWVRQPPDFAVLEDPQLLPRLELYWYFSERKYRGYIVLIGNRENESVQRKAFMTNGKSQNGIFGKGKAYPIYDWTNDDVWLYIKTRNIPFPGIYMNLYRVGQAKNQLRVSYLFSLDAARGLNDTAVMYPGLMDAILKREPNAYLCSLYWDSEMFKKNSKARKELEGKKDPVMVRNHVMQLLSDIPKNFDTVQQRIMPYRYRRFILKFGSFFDDKDWQACEESLTVGDLNGRVMRRMMISMMKRESTRIKKEGAAYVKEARQTQ